MDKLILEEISCTDDLLPFTATRSVLDIRMGILTFREKWERLLGNGRFGLGSGPALPANCLPTAALAARVREEFERGPLGQPAIDRLITHARLIRLPWHIFQHNAEALLEDYQSADYGPEIAVDTLLCAGRSPRSYLYRARRASGTLYTECIDWPDLYCA